VFDSPYISWSTPNFFFELAASDPLLDPERLISGLFYDPDDFVFVEIVHGTYSEEEYMLNDTLELNIAAKLYYRGQNTLVVNVT
jgi:hypothetical protein